ncbi:MAG TPA: cobaltochelatase subunit CobN, partial [Rhodospirillales bacterium]|nr:cobaltochelatase subunit CobN [Rhodospirillales bacterium]
MHLLSAAAAGGADVEEAVDLDQSPGEILVLSAADTELACLARARAACEVPLPSLRLANLLKLSHPYSVDLYVEKTVRRARFVLLRLLGGRSYWAYGLEQIASACGEEGIPLLVLPGDDKPDPELARLTTVDREVADRVWAYLTHGGLANAEHCLRYLASLLGRELDWREPVPLPPAGVWLPDRGLLEIEAVAASWQRDRPAVPVLFYRALYASGDLAPVEALVRALDDRGLAPLPVFVTSLKDPAARAPLEALLDTVPPALVLNATAFASASPGDSAGGPLARFDAPVLQLVFAGRDRESWQADPQGLGPRDLAMQVALPEVDGRILSRAVAFKELAEIDPATECPLMHYRPLDDRIAFVAELAAAWVRLARTPRAERRIALVLANYPSRDGRIANGVGLDTPESCVGVLRALAAAGYRVEGIPPDGDALLAALRAGPTNRPGTLAERAIRIRLPLADYRSWFATLPEELRARLLDRWGPPEEDPQVADGAFALALLPLGNLVVGIQPARGYQIDPVRSYHSPDLLPPHGYLAFYCWLREVWGCHAVVHLGKHGNLEWLPGKALALSRDCLPEVALGPLPHLYPFIVNDPGEGSQAKRRAGAVILDHLTPPMTRAESYGTLRELERLVDEYWEASQLDPRRMEPLAEEIALTSRRLGLDRDLGLEIGEDATAWLQTLDNHLCELKELQ